MQVSKSIGKSVLLGEMEQDYFYWFICYVCSLILYLFQVKSVEEIEQHIAEAEARIEIGEN